MKNKLLFIFCLLSLSLHSQTIADFENIDLEIGTFDNWADDGVFYSGNTALPNFYSEEYDFWADWSISATTDTMTAGLANQYSSMAGGGVDGSSAYAVASAFFPTTIDLTGDAAGEPVSGLYVNNNAYGYYSLLEGDDFAKKFGGETGDDPDFFLLTISGELNGEPTAASVEFYLADYRSADNAMDYIVKDWTYVDLQSLGNVDKLIFSLSSSDTGGAGMNTPAYFCVDNIITAGTPVSVEDRRFDHKLIAAPNPTTDFLYLDWPEAEQAQATIWNAAGQLLGTYRLREGRNSIAVSHLAAGLYTIRYSNEKGWNTLRFVKQ